ncbi:hypothetical protein PR048_007802 [Dryococelus australis]|uniref:Uncharacterized protein n=1 Tax=Dryococelus australis TaxID=614101 RepID=A0ABQ9HVA7_9NEOP|nr:hypothetical protein PR048_007802 [Dryococelus australis]
MQAVLAAFSYSRASQKGPTGQPAHRLTKRRGSRWITPQQRWTAYPAPAAARGGIAPLLLSQYSAPVATYPFPVTLLKFADIRRALLHTVELLDEETSDFTHKADLSWYSLIGAGTAGLGKREVLGSNPSLYQGEPGSIHGGKKRVGGGGHFRFSHVGIVPEDAAGRRVSSGISRLPLPCIPVLLHIHISSHSSALKTSEVSMERRRNARSRGRGDGRLPGKTRRTATISHMRKSGDDPAGTRTRFALVGGEQSNHYTTPRAPFGQVERARTVRVDPPVFGITRHSADRSRCCRKSPLEIFQPETTGRLKVARRGVERGVARVRTRAVGRQIEISEVRDLVLGQAVTHARREMITVRYSERDSRNKHALGGVRRTAERVTEVSKEHNLLVKLCFCAASYRMEVSLTAQSPAPQSGGAPTDCAPGDRLEKSRSDFPRFPTKIAPWRILEWFLTKGRFLLLLRSSFPEQLTPALTTSLSTRRGSRYNHCQRHNQSQRLASRFTVSLYQPLGYRMLLQGILRSDKPAAGFDCAAGNVHIFCHHGMDKSQMQKEWEAGVISSRSYLRSQRSPARGAQRSQAQCWQTSLFKHARPRVCVNEELTSCPCVEACACFDAARDAKGGKGGARELRRQLPSARNRR